MTVVPVRSSDGLYFTLTIGPLIPPDRLEGEADIATDALKAYVETVLPRDPDRPY